MNLSSQRLSREERSVLNLGLGFVITPHYIAFRTRIDLYKSMRLLKLRAFFGTQLFDKKMFRPKSQFTPCIQNEDIMAFEKLVMRDVEVLENKGYYQGHNLSVKESKALNDLANDQSIVIKSADKGGAIVIMDRADYVEEANRQLQDASFYEPINGDPTKHLQRLSTLVCREAFAMGIIEKGEFEYLQVPFPRVPIFYTLPKIHKGTSPAPLAGRWPAGVGAPLNHSQPTWTAFCKLDSSDGNSSLT